MAYVEQYLKTEQRYRYVGSGTKPTTTDNGNSIPVKSELWDTGNNLAGFEWDGSGWKQTHSNGVPITKDNGAPGDLETRVATFDEAADLPSDEASVTTSELYTFDGFASGLKRCRVTWNSSVNEIPITGPVSVTLNADDDVTAASRLSRTDVGEGGTGSSDTQKRLVSPQNPIVEWDLRGTGEDVTRVDMVGSAVAGTGAASVFVNVEVW